MRDSVFILLAGFGFVAFLWSLRQGRIGKMQFAVLDGEDEDIKIAPGSFSGIRSAEDTAEQAAREFLRQKNSGNIEKARKLGERFARAVLEPGQGPLERELEGKSAQIKHHQYLLYSYGVNRAIAEHAPNSILAQTSLNVFYGEIEAASVELYKYVSDMAAFSLYILCERSPNRTDDEIGLIFAELCGEKNNQELARYGNKLFETIRAFCLDEIHKTNYRDM